MNSGQGMRKRDWGRAGASAVAMVVALGWAGVGLAQEAPPAAQAQEGEGLENPAGAPEAGAPDAYGTSDPYA